MRGYSLSVQGEVSPRLKKPCPEANRPIKWLVREDGLSNLGWYNSSGIVNDRRLPLKVTVRFFASYREKAGRSQLEVELPTGATVADVSTVIHKRFPQITDVTEGLLLAVNAEFAEPDHILKEGDEVAFIPPVSGGEG